MSLNGTYAVAGALEGVARGIELGSTLKERKRRGEREDQEFEFRRARLEKADAREDVENLREDEDRAYTKTRREKLDPMADEVANLTLEGKRADAARRPIEDKHKDKEHQLRSDALLLSVNREKDAETRRVMAQGMMDLMNDGQVSPEVKAVLDQKYPGIVRVKILPNTKGNHDEDRLLITREVLDEDPMGNVNSKSIDTTVRLPDFMMAVEGKWTPSRARGLSEEGKAELSLRTDARKSGMEASASAISLQAQRDTAAKQWEELNAKLEKTKGKKEDPRDWDKLKALEMEISALDRKLAGSKGKAGAYAGALSGTAGETAAAPATDVAEETDAVADMEFPADAQSELQAGRVVVDPDGNKWKLVDGKPVKVE